MAYYLTHDSVSSMASYYTVIVWMYVIQFHHMGEFMVTLVEVVSIGMHTHARVKLN